MSSLSDADALHIWRSRLRERLREASEPIFASGHDICPAASMWVMMRHEVERLRKQAAHSAPLPTAASIPGLAIILAALWLEISLRINPEALPVEGHMSPSKGAALISVQNILATLTTDLAGTVTIASDWGSGRVLSEKLLPAIFSAEIICLGPCQPRVWEALQG